MPDVQPQPFTLHAALYSIYYMEPRRMEPRRLEPTKRNLMKFDWLPLKNDLQSLLKCLSQMSLQTEALQRSWNWQAEHQTPVTFANPCRHLPRSFARGKPAYLNPAGKHMWSHTW